MLPPHSCRLSGHPFKTDQIFKFHLKCPEGPQMPCFETLQLKTVAITGTQWGKIALTFQCYLIKSLNEAPVILHHLFTTLFFPPPIQHRRQHVSGKVETKKEEGRQRRRRMEREEEQRMRAYIKAAFTDICALAVESPYEYQYEPMKRKHSPFFPSH